MPAESQCDVRSGRSVSGVAEVSRSAAGWDLQSKREGESSSACAEVFGGQSPTACEHAVARLRDGPIVVPLNQLSDLSELLGSSMDLDSARASVFIDDSSRKFVIDSRFDFVELSGRGFKSFESGIV